MPNRVESTSDCSRNGTSACRKFVVSIGNYPEGGWDVSDALFDKFVIDFANDSYAYRWDRTEGTVQLGSMSDGEFEEASNGDTVGAVTIRVWRHHA